VTLLLLSQEYLAEHPDGYSYTRFCELRKQWRGQLGATTYGSITSILRHGLEKSLFAKLAAGDWITRHENLIIIGKTGLGNSSSKVAWCGGRRRLAARRLQ